LFTYTTFILLSSEPTYVSVLYYAYIYVMHRNFLLYIKYMYRAQAMIYSIYFSKIEPFLSISFF